MPTRTDPNEDADSRKSILVGDCVNSFDSDGYCIASELPWADVSAFAEESADDLGSENFHLSVSVPSSVLENIEGHDVRYLKTQDDVYMIHDTDTDIHYFFLTDIDNTKQLNY